MRTMFFIIAIVQFSAGNPGLGALFLALALLTKKR